MSDEPVDVYGDRAEPSDAPRPILIFIAVLALVALTAELYVGISSAFAPTVDVQEAQSPAQTAAPVTPGAPVEPAQQPQQQEQAAPAETPSLPVQVPPAGG